MKTLRRTTRRGGRNRISPFSSLSIRIRKLNEVPGFIERKNPSPTLLRRAPSPHGRGLSFVGRVEVRKTALSLGERVARCRRFHQPERAG
jgi:hypothetical protein